MNERIKELAEQAAQEIRVEHNNAYWRMQDEIKEDSAWREKFAELIVEDTINIMNQEWYDWNNAPKVEGEAPRDVGIRVGAKSQTIRLMHMIKKHFGVE